MTQAALQITSDTLCADILPRGASLVGLRFAEQTRNMVLGFADVADHRRIPVYAGALVGPVANRIAGGRVVLDGKAHQMPLNENGVTTLHSGPEGLHSQLWTVAAQDAGSVTLRCTLQDGQCGLPGTRQITARYALEGDTLTLDISATTDAPTVMNIAAHPYWNLDGSSDVSGHSLQVNAGSYLPTDDANLPRAAPQPVTDTPFDFTAPAPVPLIPALDVNFCLPDSASDKPAATLRGADGTTLRITTTAPGLQVYNGAYLPKTDAIWQDGPPVAPYAAIALEPQHWPDAPRNKGFPPITLMPKSTYRQITRYTLTVE